MEMEMEMEIEIHGNSPFPENLACLLRTPYFEQ